MFLSRLVRTLRSIPFAALTLALMLAFAVPAALEAQVGSSTDIITGHVRGEGGRPLEGARVEVTSVETQVVRTKLTNASGQYTVVFPDGGGQYVVVVRFLGMAPQTIRVTRQADEDRLVADASLSTVPTTRANR
jgi:hypothetical protein